MENMEKITWRIWELEGLGKALLIGGLLFYVPFLNLILLGYYGQWIRRLSLKRGLVLPEWANGRDLLADFIRVLAPAALWLLAPALLAGLLIWGVSGILQWLYLGFFTATLPLVWVPFSLVALLCPPAFTLSLMRLYRTENLRVALAFADILQTVVRRLRDCLFPLFQFYGILAVGFPLLGFAAFLAALPLFAQLVLIFSEEDDGLKKSF